MLRRMTRGGLTYMKMGQFDTAIADYDSALRFEPKLRARCMDAGLLKLKKGDRVGGDADISAAMKIQAKIGADFTRLWSAIEATRRSTADSGEAKAVPGSAKACRSRTGSESKNRSRFRRPSPATGAARHQALQPIELGVSNLGSRCAVRCCGAARTRFVFRLRNMTIQIFSF